jgi:alkyldihydroxyacetonephosphate synthase
MATQDLHPKNSENNDSKWGHKWGFADTEFVVNDDGSVTLTGDRYPLCGHKLPYFLPYMEEAIGVSIDWKSPRQEVLDKPVPPARYNEQFYQILNQYFPSHCYSADDHDRLLHSHGFTMIDETNKVLYDKVDQVVDLVFYLESEADAQKLIQLAAQHNVCLVPFGGGTSVSGALMMPHQEERMIVAIDTKRMNQIEWIDTDNGRACVQAGITGKQLDETLEKVGFTSGHEPDSREFSTLGGWIATNASGMKKNRYGNIEDIVETIHLITPAGELTEQFPSPRNSMGMPIQNLAFGSEGNLGLITKAIIRIRPLPEVQNYGSLVFPDFDTGVKFLHKLSQTNFVPASIRLVDNDQFRWGQSIKPQTTGWSAWISRLQQLYLLRVLKFSPHKLVAATIVMEGSKQEVTYQEKSIKALAKQYDGISGGSTSGQRGYLLTYAIAYIGQFVLSYELFGETFETTVPWTKIQAVRRAVKSELVELHRKFDLPGKPYVCSRVTQVYPTGVCMYFTMLLYTKDIEGGPEIFNHIYKSLRSKIIEHGGSLSHHHGIGKIRKDYLKDVLSPASIQLLQKLKEASDPHNIFGVRNNVMGLQQTRNETT